MRPRRLRPMIVGVPLEPGVGGMGGEYDIDAEGVDGGGPDPTRGAQHGEVFPARAGMNRERNGRADSAGGVPRAGGDEPRWTLARWPGW